MPGNSSILFSKILLSILFFCLTFSVRILLHFFWVLTLHGIVTIHKLLNGKNQWNLFIFLGSWALHKPCIVLVSFVCCKSSLVFLLAVVRRTAHFPCIFIQAILEIDTFSPLLTVILSSVSGSLLILNILTNNVPFPLVLEFGLKWLRKENFSFYFCGYLLACGEFGRNPKILTVLNFL